MDNAMEVYEPNHDITIYRAPEIILAEAQKAAKSLADVVSKKKNPVMMNGEQYLEFEDWQTVGRFYGVTAKVVSTAFIEYGTVQGFEAKAVAVRADGAEISGAEAMCLNDEPNWKIKPLFQLRSMAQTRACSKALRNVLAWVVVLAGYRPTPAEEIQDMAKCGVKESIKEPQKKAEKKTQEAEQVVTVKIASVGSKQGAKKDGSAYTIYTVFDENDVKYATFDTKIGELATSSKESGSPVQITFTVGQYGPKITNLEVVT